ncbi:MAG: histidine phosphatase family protein [Paracoccaceae bacterium]
MPPKRIHFIRHAQSEHNARAAEAPDEDVLRRDPTLRDAQLTELGHTQARALAQEVSQLHDIELVVVSPLSRAIQTAIAAFERHPAPRLIQPLHREMQESYCDIGQSPAHLAKAFPTFDFDHLDDPWWHSDTLDGWPYPREPLHAFEGRVTAFREWLIGRPESCIAVVGHGTFLNRLTGTVFANAQRLEVEF